MADVLFNLRGGATALFDDPPTLDQVRVHQQADYDPVNQLIYATQVIANGVKLADEDEPPPDGVRDSRGDLAINRVTLAGEVTGVMYCRRFDHGAGIGVEYEASTDTTWLWLAYDADQQPIGTNAHGRKIVRLPFVDQDIVDVGREGLDVYDPFTGTVSITPGLDLAAGRMTVAYSLGAGTRYTAFDLGAFKAKDYSTPLYSFPRPVYPDIQSWTAYGEYIYQLHGTAYSTTNPPPPDGQGDAYFTVIDVRTGNAIDRVPNTYALSLDYREPESIAVWNLPSGPQLTFGFAVSEPPRRMALYGVTATVDTGVAIRADPVQVPQAGVQLTVSVADLASIQTWEIGRVVSGVRQKLFSGSAGSLPQVSTWFDSAPPGCIPLTYYLTVHRVTGTNDDEQSTPLTFLPPGGCNQAGEAVGDQDNVLGCAQGYTAQIHWRGGALPYPSGALDKLTEVSWSRTINDIAEASVTLQRGNVSDECCEALGQAWPWVHELTLYRDGELVWQGPIFRVRIRRDTLVIDAQDVFTWFDRMVNTFRVTYTSTQPDSQGRKTGPITQIAENHIRLNMMGSSLAEPDFAGIMDYLVVRDEGLPTIKVEKDGSSNTTIWTAFLGDILREWTKRGLTWATVGRALLLRAKPTSTTRAQARLTLEDFTGDVEIIKDGSAGGVYGFATTQDQQDISKGKTLGYGMTKTAFGRLDRLVELDEENVKDADLLNAAKDSIAGRYPVPISISIPDGSALAPTAQITVEQLVPGERVDVFADAWCTRVLQGFILTDVEGSWQQGQEQIAITLAPLADLSGELIT